MLGLSQIRWIVLIESEANTEPYAFDMDLDPLDVLAMGEAPNSDNDADAQAHADENLAPVGSASASPESDSMQRELRKKSRDWDWACEEDVRQQSLARSLVVFQVIGVLV